MFGTIMSAAGLIQGILSVATLVFAVGAMLRPDRETAENYERASMRSHSWPAAR